MLQRKQTNQHCSLHCRIQDDMRLSICQANASRTVWFAPIVRGTFAKEVHTGVLGAIAVFIDSASTRWTTSNEDSLDIQFSVDLQCSVDIQCSVNT